MNTAELTDLLIQQNHIGSVIKVSSTVFILIKLSLYPKFLLIYSTQARKLRLETHYWLAGHLGNPGFLNAVIQAVAVGGRERSRLGQKRLGAEMRPGSVSDRV